MRAVLIILASMVAVEALAFTIFPEGARRLLTALSPGELRLAGVLECGVAVAAIYYAIVA